MLHHDGWKEMYEVDEEGASTLRWLDLSFWRHEQIQQEAEEKECVPMVDWQTTSYPNCNVGKLFFVVDVSNPIKYYSY
jgi:hypothetical protein